MFLDVDGTQCYRTIRLQTCEVECQSRSEGLKDNSLSCLKMYLGRERSDSCDN